MQGNIHSFPPNIDPQVFALLAALVGSALSGDFDAYEQSSIGNWLMLVGEYMLEFKILISISIVENIKMAVVSMRIMERVIKIKEMK